MALLIGLGLLAGAAPLPAATMPFAADFEAGPDAVAAAGWRLSDACSVVNEEPEAGERCLKVAAPDGTPRYAEIFLPVETGRF